MYMSKSMMTVVIGFLMLTSCGNPPSDDVSQESDTRLVELTPRLVLGTGDYDEECSFAMVSDTDFLSDGSIAVLDRLKCSVSVFSRTGEYLYSIGRNGDGPGEFTSPGRMICIGDSLVITDRSAIRASVFSQSGDYIRELSDSYSTQLPSESDNMGARRILGGVTVVSPSSDDIDLNLTYLLLVFDMQYNAVDTLLSHTFLHDPEDISYSLHNTAYSTTFAADDEGNYFLAPVSTDEYSINGFNQNGDTLVSINRNLSPVEKTAQALDEEADRMIRILEAINPGYEYSYEPLACRYMIPPYGLHTDSCDRIWVLNGLFSMPMFDVYDYAGEHLFIAKAHGIPVEEQNEMLRWTVTEHGLIAFSVDPIEYPRVYVYDLP